VKILLATHHFLPRHFGGVEQHTYRIARALGKQGHTVEIACIESVTAGGLIPTCAIERYEDLVVHRLSLNLRQAPDPLRWSYRNPQLGHWFEGLLRSRCPDVLHVNGGYLLGGAVPEAAFELGIPTVLTLHDYWFMCPRIILLRPSGARCDGPVAPARCAWCMLSDRRRYSLPDRWLWGGLGDLFVRLNRSQVAARVLGTSSHLEAMAERRVYLKQVLERMDAVVSPSRFLIEKVQEYGFAPRRMVYQPLGLDEPPALSSKAGERPERLRIGYLGQLAPHKGVHLLLTAFHGLAGPCELTLHGDVSATDPYQQRLLRVARGNPSIRFAGPYPNRLVSQVLSELDVVVVPSVWHEIGPTVMAEAHAARTPVVASRLGGMAELIVHGENGLLFEAGNSKDLRAQLQRLLDEPALLSRLRRGIQPVPTLAEERTALVALYESLLHR
jgi:glycosyltransferase involved in cell wall biosynthesis